MATPQFDVVVVGAGIIGLATARELQHRRPEARVAVLDKEVSPGAHQTSHSSGVVHRGVYYAPGSLKAQLCVEGAAALLAYCDERGIPVLRCGKVVVATDAAELPRLEELHRRSLANGVPGVELIGPERLRELEPHVAGVRALHSPETAVVDFGRVAAAYADDVRAAGGELLLGREVVGLSRRAGSRSWRRVPGRSRPHASSCVGASTPTGSPHCRTPRWSRGSCRSGATTCGFGPSGVISSAGSSTRCPTRRSRSSASTRRSGRTATSGSARTPCPRSHARATGGATSPCATFGMRSARRASAASRGATGAWASERWRATSRRGASSAPPRKLLPELEVADVLPGPSGIRAQALAVDGTLLDDFVFHEADGVVHVRNAPSPGATSSLAIARVIADRV